MNDARKNGWSDTEWQEMEGRLETLSLNQLKELAVAVGIRFEGGIESVHDKKGMSAKEQIIRVLDETPKAELIARYDMIARK